MNTAFKKVFCYKNGSKAPGNFVFSELNITWHSSVLSSKEGIKTILKKLMKYKGEERQRVKKENKNRV
jgi:hypothetical protein